MVFGRPGVVVNMVFDRPSVVVNADRRARQCECTYTWVTQYTDYMGNTFGHLHQFFSIVTIFFTQLKIIVKK